MIRKGEQGSGAPVAHGIVEARGRIYSCSVCDATAIDAPYLGPGSWRLMGYMFIGGDAGNRPTSLADVPTSTLGLDNQRLWRGFSHPLHIVLFAGHLMEIGY